jgi:hypothetical protein
MRKSVQILIAGIVLGLLASALPRSPLRSASFLGVASADDDHGKPTPSPTKVPTPKPTAKPTPQSTPTCMPQKSKKRPCGDDDGGD